MKSQLKNLAYAFVGYCFLINMFITLGFADNISIDRDQLKKVLQEEITSRINDAIESGKQQLEDAAMDRVYQEVRKVISDNIDTQKIQEQVNKFLTEHETIKWALDDYKNGRSEEVIDNLKSLYGDAQTQLQNIINSTNAYQAEEIPEAEYKQLLEQYGFKGKWIDKIGEWEQYYQKFGASKVEDLKTLYEGFEGGAPGGQLVAMFALMEKYSDKVPGLGMFIKLYAQVGKEMLSAAIRAGQVIREREQGCLGDGTHGGIKNWYNVGDPVNIAFNEVHGGHTACPTAIENIFSDMSDASLLYFWTGKGFLVGQSGNGGIDAIIQIQAFLVEVQKADKIKDLATLHKFYNHNFPALKKLVNIMLGRISEHLTRLDFIRITCGESAYNSLIREHGNFTTTQQNFEDRREDIFNRIILSRVLEGGRAFRTYDMAEKSLSQLYPVVVRGRVYEKVAGGTKYVEGASVNIQTNGFGIFSECKILQSDTEGHYKFVALLSGDEATCELQAVKGNRESKPEERLLQRENPYEDSVNLLLEADADTTRTLKSVIVTPGDAKITVGESKSFMAEAVYDDNSTKNVTLLASWTGGMKNSFTGNAPGSATMTATYTGISGNASITVTCPEDRPEWNAELGECTSLQSGIDSLTTGEEEKGLCDENAMQTAWLLIQQIVAEASAVNSSFQAKYQKFLKEVNDQNSNVCDNNILAIAFAGAKRELTEYEILVSELEGLATNLILQLGMCPDLTITITGGQVIRELAKLGGPYGQMKVGLADMQSMLGKNGCDEDEVTERGEQLAENTGDPNVIDDGGATGEEVCGDGKDNDGDGLIDEGCGSLGNSNVTIFLYDSGSAKDDVFSLSVSGYGNRGTTPEGGARTYPLSLSPGSYVATVTVISAPDDVGTFTITIKEGDRVIGGQSGSPGQGTIMNVPFTVGAPVTANAPVFFNASSFEVELIVFPDEVGMSRQKHDPFGDDNENHQELQLQQQRKDNRKK